MSVRRISLGLSTFAVVAVSVVMGSPVASAEIRELWVTTDTSAHWPGRIFNDWDATARLSPCNTLPVHFTDNGKPMPGSPVTPDCVTQPGEANVSIAFRPTTLGTHRVVATQLNPDGSVASTSVREVNVDCLPPLADHSIGCRFGSGSFEHLGSGSFGS
ncbi:hypothetical protein ACWIGI_28125 [Nocardia sp. NPDC055321]